MSSTSNSKDEHVIEEIEVEVSDKELEQELLEEYTILNNTNNTFFNDTSFTNTSENLPENTYSNELTSFQDSVITTGSGVSIILLFLLFLIFIIQAIRKAYNFFSIQSKINSVDNPLLEAKEVPAENITPISVIDPKSYPKYDTPFIERDIYREKLQNGSSSVIKNCLLNRAVKCIDKMGPLQRDGAGIRKNWNIDLLPRDVWDDYQSAQRNLQKEIDDVKQENRKYEFRWDRYGPDIFAYARDVFIASIKQKKNAMYRQHMQQKYQNQREQYQNINRSDGKNFGSGYQKGYLDGSGNQTTGRIKLSKKERNELRKKQKQEKYLKYKQELQNGMIGDGIRKRGGKRRFANK